MAWLCLLTPWHQRYSHPSCKTIQWTQPHVPKAADVIHIKSFRAFHKSKTVSSSMWGWKLTGKKTSQLQLPWIFFNALGLKPSLGNGLFKSRACKKCRTLSQYVGKWRRPTNENTLNGPESYSNINVFNAKQCFRTSPEKAHVPLIGCLALGASIHIGEGPSSHSYHGACIDFWIDLI